MPWFVLSLLLLSGIAAALLYQYQRSAKTAAAPYTFHIVATGHISSTPQRLPHTSPTAPNQKKVNAHTSIQQHQNGIHRTPQQFTQSPPSSDVRILTSRQKVQLISEYIRYWITTVQEMANQRLQGKIQGALTIRVVVASDGALQSVRLLHTSSAPQVTKNALDVLYATAPYAAFPEKLAREAPQLIIHCSMSFEKSSDVTTRAPREDTQNASLGQTLGNALTNTD